MARKNVAVRSGRKNHQCLNLKGFQKGASGPPITGIDSCPSRRIRSVVRMARKTRDPVVKTKVKTESTIGAQD